MNSPQRVGMPPSEPLKEAILSQRPRYFQAARLSVVTGLLTLTPSWFMLEVYGRVLDSRSAATLGWLLLAICGIYAVLELLDWVRSRALYAAGEAIDEQVRLRVFDTVFEANLRKVPGGTTQLFADLKTIKEFISAPVISALMDLPAALVCLILLFVISPWLCAMALVGAVLQVCLAFITERRTMPLLTEASRASIEAHVYANASLRNAQVIESMGMLGNIHKRWMGRQRLFLARQAEASDHAGLTGMAAKLIQNMQSSLLLGGACWMALHDQLIGGAGMMIVASILGGRVLQPLAQIVAQWRTIVTVRDAYARLSAVINKIPVVEPGMALPAPKGVLTVEGVVAGAPSSQSPILRGVSFGIAPGDVLMVVGPSAAGKSTLARLLVGIWPAASGKVRLDGADVHSWHKSQLGPHLGYLPQGVELFDGTVAENIARFGKVDMDKVRAAADQVGITEMVEALPLGFDTRIGEEGAVLSGGQRQRLGLARAIYDNPTLIVLDEPNSSLDDAGEKSLLALLSNLKARRATVVAITHRTTLLPAADKMLILSEGQVAAFGPRDEVLAAMAKANEQARAKAIESMRPAAARPPLAAPGAAA